MTTTNPMPLVDLAPEHDNMLDDVIEGLMQYPKRLPSKYFYDQRGSKLFDAICDLPEYYPTRTELGIMRGHMREMSQHIGRESCVIEIGSGSGIKTKMLLKSLVAPSAYVPMDISREHLVESAERLAAEYPKIEISPVCADFLQPLELPTGLPRCQNYVVYFPGSTLGNLTHSQAQELLSNFAELTSGCIDEHCVGQSRPRGGLLLGVDLQKDVRVLEAAYNDSQEVTAEFNLNILHHINRKLDCRIPVDAYRHSAPYNDAAKRIEMHLVATRDHRFVVGDQEFRMRAGESILTEYSHKYEIVQLTKQLGGCGWQVRKVWTDSNRYFALLYCDLGAICG